MPKRSSRAKKSGQTQRRRRLTKEEKETAEKLGFLNPKDGQDNIADDNLVKHMSDNIDNAETGSRKSRVSLYNNSSVTFLINGEVMECCVETIPPNTKHAFNSNLYPILILIAICIPSDTTFINFEMYMLYGSYYVTLILSVLIFLVFPCVVTSLFIGVRFQGHLSKFYMGFIGLTILHYIQAALGSTDMFHFAVIYFQQALESLIFYYPIDERCLKYSTSKLNFTYTIVCMYNQENIKVENVKSTAEILFATIFISFIVINCVSGGIFSQWKSAAIIVGSAGFMLVFESIFLAVLDGSGNGLLQFFQWNSYDYHNHIAEPGWIWMTAVRETFFSFCFGLPFIEMIGSRVSVDFPVIKGAAVATFFASLYHLAFPMLSVAMGGAAMFYYCQPIDERMDECSYEEKKQFTDIMFSNIRNDLRGPYGKMARRAPNYFTEIVFAIYPQMGRTISLLHFAATLGCIMARLFAIMIILQEHLMRFQKVSKFLSWRAMSYVLGALTAGLIVGVFHYWEYFDAWTQVITPLEISNTCAVVVIVQMFNVVAVFWFYGSYNFLNDIYVTEHKVKCFGAALAFWCQYLLPLALLAFVIICICVQLGPGLWDALTEGLKIDNPKIVLYPMASIYAALVIIPLFACCKTFKKACNEPNLKKRFGFEDLKFPKGMAAMFMSKKKCM